MQVITGVCSHHGQLILQPQLTLLFKKAQEASVKDSEAPAEEASAEAEPAEAEPAEAADAPEKTSGSEADG